MLTKKLIHISLMTTLTACFTSSSLANTQKTFSELESNFNGKIGVYALDTSNQHAITYRAHEAFPFQSTFKLIVIGAILKKSMQHPNLLQKNINYRKQDLVSWSPITKKYTGTGMPISDLAAAAIRHSDNTAANLIIQNLGGPKKVTIFAHAIGNPSFSLQHFEPNLNSNPQQPQDSATPADMAKSLQTLLMSDVLAKPQRKLLRHWLLANATGDARIRAGVPKAWKVADKTGSGTYYGVANDLGLIWPTHCKPVLLSIYTVRYAKQAKRHEALVATITQQIFKEFAKTDPCIRQALQQSHR